jgi:hypothetical protein
MRARTSLLGKQEAERVQLKPSYNLPEDRNQKAPIDPLKQDFHVRVIQVEKDLLRKR